MSNQTINPRQHAAFWAEMRSTAYLFSKSTWPTQEQCAKLLSELRDILGKRTLTYPQTFSEFGIGPETPYKMKRAFLGLTKPFANQETEESEQRFMKFLANKAVQAQKHNWTWRITQEAEEKQKEGWYPFFITLTIDPKMCDGKETILENGQKLPGYNSPEELWRKGREFRRYIRRLANIAAEELGHPPPHKKTKDFDYRPESDYVTYAGVIEHGKSQEHHHAHIMVWMKEIPANWKIDPNHGNPWKCQRECKPIRTEWPWAIPSQKPALYFRTKGDIWSKLGFVTPIDERNGQPIKINPVQAVGSYVTKYMQKGTKIWHHRMKCTRNLGMKKLQTIIMQLDQPTIQALTWSPRNSKSLLSVSLIHSVPQGLLRSLAKQQNFALLYPKGLLDLKTLMKTNYETYKLMLMSVKDGARPDRMPSAQFYDWVQKHQTEPIGYCEKKLLAAHKRLEVHFKKPVFTTQAIVLGANDVGFTQCI